MGVLISFQKFYKVEYVIYVGNEKDAFLFPLIIMPLIRIQTNHFRLHKKKKNVYRDEPAANKKIVDDHNCSSFLSSKRS